MALCHSERSEESAFVRPAPELQIFRCAQDDNPWRSVILSEAKNLHLFALHRNYRSFAALRMTSHCQARSSYSMDDYL
jgi:nitrate reductase alpha subunit